MVWKIEIEAPARKQFHKLGHAPAARIVAGLKKIALPPDPRTRAKAMVDEWDDYYRFRFDDFRVIARIEDGRMVIIIVTVGHRRNVYR